MLTDGLTLVGNSEIGREVVDSGKRVSALPSTVTDDEVIRLLVQEGNNLPGLYLGKGGNWIALDSPVSKAYDIASGVVGKPEDDATILNVPMVRAVDFDANMGGSVGKAITAATAETSFEIRKNGTAIGTMVFAAAGTDASFTVASAVSFAVGDILSIHAPATADATLADFGYTLKGVLA